MVVYWARLGTGIPDPISKWDGMGREEKGWDEM